MKIMLAVALAVLVPFASPARAFEWNVDCSSTSFKFSDPAYNIDCESAWMGAGAADIMTVTNNERTIFFTMVERRIKGQPHTYLEYRSLRENFSAMFKDEGVTDWKELDKNAGFETAEFSQDINGLDSHCMAAQRYSNPMYTGYKRQLVGIGCAVGDLQPVYQILQQMDGD
jgi:hypothetical protein